MGNTPYVVSTMNYLRDGSHPPAMFWRERRDGEPQADPDWEPHEIRIHDIRGREGDYDLDRDGFEIIGIDVEAPQSQDREAIEGAYYAAVCDRVKAEIGASHVIAFDDNYRSAGAKYNTVTDKPAYLVHNDYTEDSAPQRIRDLLASDEAEWRLKKRYAFINLWRPVNHPAEDLPLGVCRADSLDQADFVPCAMYWPEREGEIYLLQHNPGHEWFYLSRMATNEALLLKCFDSARDGRARYAPHTAFQDPTGRPGAKPRESVEVRTIAFFD
jgi:hypothetical protein